MMLMLSEVAVAALAVAAIASDNDQGILTVPQAGAERSEGMEAIGIVQC